MARTFRIWVVSSIIFMIFLNFSIFFWDFFAGQNTLPLFVLEPYAGIGMFYVYMIGFFSSFIVMWAILRTNKFGMGFYIWLPYAVIGLFVEAYFELILTPALKSFWGVIGYCAFGLLTGFSADLTYFLLQKNTRVRREIAAGLTGIVMNLVYFITVVIAISIFYNGEFQVDLQNAGTFLGLAYFGLPWLCGNAFFGGLGAYGLHALYPIKVSKT